MRLLVLVLASLLTSAACAPHAFVPPVGVAEPAPEAAMAWAEATAHCRAAATYSAQIHVSGTAGATHLNSQLAGAVTMLDHILLELRKFGQLGFKLAGEGALATLVLPRDKRVIKARADEIVEALTGLKWGPRQLLSVLTGCVTTSADMTRAVRIGQMLSVSSGNATVFLRQHEGHWQVAAGILDGQVIEYVEATGEWPGRLRVKSEAGRVPAVDLTILLEQLNVNVSMEPSSFTVVVPPDAVPLTLDELRSIGPLAEKGRGGSPSGFVP